MSFTNAFAADVLELIFNATAMANWADNAASSPETSIGCALHTGDPGEAGDQTTSEAAYTSYARVDVARNAAWTVTVADPASVSPAANIDFPEATGGSETETYWSVAKASSDVLIGSGTLTPNIVVSSGVTPRVNTTSTITLD